MTHPNAPTLDGMAAALPAAVTGQLRQDRHLPSLLAMFVGSGCSALVYEIVWFQSLQLVIGSSAISLGVLLATFMGGMCLGSLLAPRILSPRRHPLRLYALLEAGIGIFGLLILFGMPHIDRLYADNAATGSASILLRSAICAMCLLPPTLLMGATLPAIARWVEATPRGVSWLGLFYGGNIAGAVFGCLLAGFYLLRVHDMATATYVAVGINILVAAIALVLAAVTPSRLAMDSDAAPPANSALPRRAISIHLAIALSGLCALGAEVIWTRILSLMLGATVYTFSIILAVFLVGLGIGSSFGAILCRRADPRAVLAWCQLLLAGAIAWTAYQLTHSLPYWPIQPSLSHNPWLNLQLDIVRCLWALLPAAVLWGASFPAALAAVASRGRDAGRVVGGIYAANTVGAIVGAIAFSTLLVPWIGTQHAQRTLIGLSALAGLLVVVPSLLVLRRISRSRFTIGASGLVLVSAVAAAFAWAVPAVPWELIAYGRHMPASLGQATLMYQGEGVNASVAVTQTLDGARNFHVSGKVEASSIPLDMRLQRMLGHLPALVHPQPKSILVVGCGAGVTAGSFVVHPDVQRIVICEIEPLIPQVVAGHFSFENHDVLRDSRTQVIHDDARHYVRTSRDKFDVITSDPIHPWVKGAATLYTKEYFELCRQRLNPGGVMVQWVPLYESSPAAVKSEIRTFFEVFPHGTIWSNDANGRGYDTVLLGQAEPTRIDVGRLVQRLGREDHAAVAQSLFDVGFASAVELLGTYAGRSADLKPWLRDAEINRDRNLRLQYLAGLGLDLTRGEEIFDDMAAHCQYPDDLFLASTELRRALKIEMTRGTVRRLAER